MNKVMTRLQRTPGTRPPGRRDTRRPTDTPPRTRQTRPTPPPTPTHTPQTPTPQPRPTQPPTPQPQPRPASPHPTHNSHRPPAQPRPTDLFADRLLAVLSGQRPVHSMLRHTKGRAYDDLSDLAEHGPLRTTHGVRPIVRDIGYYVPRPGAIEAFARIGAGDRLRALAFRLELGADRRWRCTAVEVGGPRKPHTQDD